MVSRILLSFCFLVVFSEVLHSSDRITFTGTRYRSGQYAKVDKIKIINKSKYAEWTTHDTILVKEALSVYEPGQENSGADVWFDASGNLNIISAVNDAMQSCVYIYDFLGNLLSAKSLYLVNGINHLDLQNLIRHDGLYLIRVQQGGENRKRTLCYGTGWLQSVVNLEKTELIEQSALYDFIGYNANFKPDTILNVDVNKTDSVKFVFYDDALYNFKSGYVELDSVFINYTISSETTDQINPKNNYSYSKKDSNFISLRVDLSVLERRISSMAVLGGLIECQNIFNINDAVNFCTVQQKFYGDKSYDTESVFKNTAAIVIDNNSNNFLTSKITFENYILIRNLSEPIMFPDKESYIFTFDFNNISFLINQTDNSYYSTIINLNDQNFKLYYNIQYESWRGHYIVTHTDEVLDSYILIPGVTKLKIVLNQ